MSLWGEEFEVKKEPEQAKKILDKIKKPKVAKSVKATKAPTSASTSALLASIREEVYRILGKFADDTIVIRDRQSLTNYIDAAIQCGYIAIDTETNNSLDPISCKLMGPCLYVPGQKSAYVPLHHIDYKTQELLPDQLTEEDVRQELSRLTNTKIIMHNGKFDYQVIKCTTGVTLSVYWDTEIAARILNENELAALKKQYIAHIDANQEKYSIDHLFADVEYAIVPPEVFALYAATDALITFQLYEWQKEQFSIRGHERLYDLFMNIEMPVVIVTAEMELQGVEIDQEYAARLSAKYHKEVDIVDEKIAKALLGYKDKIDAWRQTAAANEHPISKKPDKNGNYTPQKSKNEQLADPPQLTSPTQLAIVLYDIFETPVIDKKTPRGTGEEILLQIKNPLCSLILEKRGLEKLLSTYIDKLPKCVSPVDGRLHAHFNQIGAGTGRFSSSDPNLQNIPSHMKNIRLMFRASEGNVFCGGDFSQQEPRLLCMYSNDVKMTSAYKDGKDLYATIASGVYKNDYWDNMEKHQDGTANPAGKKRRSNCKSILLGLMYGRGAPSIAEQIHASVPEAQKIIDDFYKGFPQVKEWMDKTEKDAKVTGYVEDYWGRRRRLPDIKLPKYTIKSTSGTSSTFNPLIGAQGVFDNGAEALIKKYEKQLESVKSRQAYSKIKNDAYNEGITIIDNSMFVSQAERQCVNARVQGGAATMTKICMRKIFDCQELRDLDAHLALQIHDEVIMECPKENADKVAEILSNTMKTCIKEYSDMPFKADCEVTTRWYEDDMGDILKQELEELLSDKSDAEARAILAAKYTEFLPEELGMLLKSD